jgi:hypothetical protein
MVITVLSLGLGTTASIAGSTKIAGQFKQKYTKQEVLPVPQAEGHMLMLTETQGSNTNRGQNDYMDSAQVVLREIVDLEQGNGSHSGYVIETSSNGDEVIAKFSGQVTTVMVEGQPNTTMKGSWSKIRGTGKYEGIKGSGTYDGHFISENEYVIDWNGYYFLNK